jgi:hypothetical protein
MERRLMVNVTILHIIVVRRFVGVYCTMYVELQYHRSHS